MIGTTVKLGFDGQSVKTGMASIGKMFGSLGKQMAIGGARRMGEGMVDIWGKLIMALPEAINQTTEWAGELVDLSNQTEVATKDLMELAEAFRMTGMESVDSGKMIGEMRKSLYAASQGPGTERDALHALGFGATDLEGLGPIEQLKALMKAMNDAKASLKPGQLETVSSSIFGSKIGLKTLRIFQDMPAAIAKARENLQGFQNISKEELAIIDDMGDSMGRWSGVKNMLTMDLMRGLLGEGGIKGATGMIDGFYNKMIGLGESFRKLGDSIRVALDAFMTTATKDGIGAAFGDVLTNFGRYIGKGIAESFQGKGASMFLPQIFGGGKSATSMNDGALLQEAETTNDILNRIYREKGAAMFA